MPSASTPALLALALASTTALRLVTPPVPLAFPQHCLPSPRLPAMCEGNEESDRIEAGVVEEPRATEESKIDALQKIIFSEFGAQALALTLLFVAFIAWSSATLTDDFWMSPL